MEVLRLVLVQAPNPKYQQVYYHGRQSGNLHLKIESEYIGKFVLFESTTYTPCIGTGIAFSLRIQVSDKDRL